MTFKEYIRFCMRHKMLPTPKHYKWCNELMAEARKIRLIEWGC